MRGLFEELRRTKIPLQNNSKTALEIYFHRKRQGDPSWHHQVQVQVYLVFKKISYNEHRLQIAS